MTVKRFRHATSPHSLKYTIQLIGDGIKHGIGYIPLRQYAASIASRAPAKDYLSQVGQLFDDFTKKRWRYVFDPVGIELVGITGNVIYDTILGFAETNPSRGYGDCDDATVAMGAILGNIGIPTRIATIAKPGARGLFDHVFVQAKIPKVGWVSVDPVGYPHHGLGWTAPHERIAYWDLNGNLLGTQGIFPGPLKQAFKQMSGYHGTEIEGGNEMSLAGFAGVEFSDYGLENYGLAGTDNEAPMNWSQHGLVDFGAYIDKPLGMISGDNVGLAMEYDNDDIVGFAGNDPLVRTKMLEMSPADVAHVRRTGRPRLHSVALSDDGDIYQWQEMQGLGGFFKKLRKKVRKATGKIVKKARSIRKGISKRARSLIKKLPGGKYLIKVHDRIKKVAMKVTKPLKKLLGSKVGKYLAPIAALIPGVGPAVAGAIALMRRAGQIDKTLAKFGVKRDKRGNPIFTSGKQAKAFTRELQKKAADHMGGVDGAYGRQSSRRYRDNPMSVPPGRRLKRGSVAHSWRLATRLRGLEGI